MGSAFKSFWRKKKENGKERGWKSRKIDAGRSKRTLR